MRYVKLNWKFDHRQIWLNAMIGMTAGFFASLIMGSITGTIGLYSSSNIFTQVRQVMGYITPFAIGASIGIRAKLKPTQIMATAAVSFLASHSTLVPDLIDGTFIFEDGYKNIIVGVHTATNLQGEILTTIFVGAIMQYFWSAVKWQSHYDFLLVPFIGTMFGILNSVYLTYIVSIGVITIEWVLYQVKSYTALSIALAPIIGGIMGTALSSPISSAALALSLRLEGDAAIAAVVGTTAQMLCWGVMSFWAERKIGVVFLVSIGSSKLHMPNYTKHPILLLFPFIVSALSALVAVGIFNGAMEFPPGPFGKVTAGMGSSALYGQIYTFVDNNAWGSLKAWMLVLFGQIIIPLFLSIITIYIITHPKLQKLNLIKKEWLQLWNNL